MSRALTLILWDRSVRHCHAETADMVARAALAAWMQEGDFLRCYREPGRTIWYVFTEEHERTDACAWVHGLSES